jgi:biofilm PGA synthesis protein PgaD
MSTDAQPVPVDYRVNPVFDSPELQAGRHRLVYSVMTFVAWIVWAWLWLPLVTLVGWYLGVRTFIREIVIPPTGTMWMSVVAYLLVIALIGIFLIIWSRYNVLRFRGDERRRAAAQVTDTEMRMRFDLSPDLLARFRDEESLVVEHDEIGRIAGVFASSDVLSIRRRSTRAAADAPQDPLDGTRRLAR